MTTARFFRSQPTVIQTLFQEIGQLEQDALTLGRFEQAIAFVERLSCGAHGPIDVLGPTLRDVDQRLAIGRVDARPGLA